MDLQTGTVTPIDSTSINPVRPRFSQSGRYVVYRNEVPNAALIVAAVDGSGRWTVPASKDLHYPVWGASDEYLYAQSLGAAEMIMRMPVSLERGFVPKGTFESVYNVRMYLRFDVNQRDGRLLVTERNSAYGNDGEIDLTFNLDEELRRIAPPD